MCDLREFVNDFCLSSLDSVTDTESGTVSHNILGISLEAVLFLVGFRLVTTLNQSFMTPAFESLSLRKGGFSEVVASVVISLTLAVPEIAISFVSAIKGNFSSNHSLAISTILGSGWITFLLIPGILGHRATFQVSRTMLVCDLGFYVFILIVLHFVVRDGHVSFLESLLLLCIYGMYFMALSRTEMIEQQIRQRQREERLLVQLAPLQLAMNEPDYLQRLPIDMAGPLDSSDEPHPSTSMYAPVESEEPTVHSIPIHEEESSALVKMLSLVCVRAMPGTDTERYYAISLINTFVLELFFTGIVSAVSNRWIQLSFGDAISVRPMLFGAVLVAFFTQLTEILRAVSANSPSACAHVFTASMSSQVLVVSVGLGLPWLVNGLVHGSTPVDDVSIILNFSLFLLMAVSTYLFVNLRGNYIHNLQRLSLAYLVTVVGFILVSY